MSIQNAIASVAVHDLAASLGWYQRLFGRQPDSRPMGEVAEWKFDGGGWLQVYQVDDARVGHCSVTLAVNSLDEQVGALKALGLDPRQEVGGDKVRAVMLKDPDGNSIAFAEARDPSIAH